jgi:hypothetical protein
MSDPEDVLFTRLRALPAPPTSPELRARVLGAARVALTEPDRTARRRAAARATFMACTSAVAVYLTWAVDFLNRLGDS